MDVDLDVFSEDLVSEAGDKTSFLHQQEDKQLTAKPKKDKIRFLLFCLINFAMGSILFAMLVGKPHFILLIQVG